MNQLVAECRARFDKEFGVSKNTSDFIACSAPGRVNLIGEHTDYNNGFVFPMALPLVTVILGKQNNTDMVNVISITMNDRISFSGKSISPDGESKTVTASKKIVKGKPKWGNYVKGVCAGFNEHICGVIPGCDFVIASTVPIGGGLSSSASLEVAVATFLEQVTCTVLSKDLKARLCQEAEHKYAAVPCGIMDQWISVHAKPGYALILDCQDCTFTNILMADSDIIILITNSNVKHELEGSEYAGRRDQCYRAASICKKDSLREVTADLLNEYKDQMDNETFRRAIHVITENERTQMAADVLQHGNFTTFGKLMNESHDSLRDNFEVSCPELDELVNIARKNPSVYGSRMTGGGFGGCTVTLVKAPDCDQLCEEIKKAYSGIPTFFLAHASEGAAVISI